MLPKNTLPDHIPDYNDMPVGEQIHVDHMDCSAGYDTKRRLYIRRADTSMWLLHCHHCGDSGVFRSKEPRSMLATATPTGSATKAFCGPIDFDKWYEFCEDLKLSKTPTTTQEVWLNHIDGEKLEECYGVMYDHTNHDIYLPILFDNASLHVPIIVGYQIRHFGPGAKYSTHMFTDDSFAFYSIKSHALIVCEDLVSMLWCIYNGFSAVCLLGTKEPVWEKFAEAIKQAKPSKVLLWLDDDPAGHSGVIKLVKAMPLVLGDIPLVTMLNGCPKHFTKEKMDDLRDSLSKGT